MPPKAAAPSRDQGGRGGPKSAIGTLSESDGDAVRLEQYPPETRVLVERRLAAILAADAVGYSRMMREDEPGALALLQKHRSEVIDPGIAKRPYCQVDGRRPAR
jgi:class 3 adenylate cyclase